MKWGRIDGASEKLLYWVRMFVLAPYFDDPLDHWLKDILVNSGGLGGDPGWEMEHIPDRQGVGVYRVWADPNMSGIEPAEAIYSTEIVRHAVRESLLYLGDAFPNKIEEIKKVIRHYDL